MDMGDDVHGTGWWLERDALPIYHLSGKCRRHRGHKVEWCLCLPRKAITATGNLDPFAIFMHICTVGVILYRMLFNFCVMQCCATMLQSELPCLLQCCNLCPHDEVRKWLEMLVVWNLPNYVLFHFIQINILHTVIRHKIDPNFYSSGCRN